MQSTAAGFENTEEGRAFLQQRVADYGRFGGSGFMAFLGFRAIAVLVLADVSQLIEPSMVYHGLAGLSLYAVWLACRSGPRSVTYLRTVESVGLLAATVATVAMGMKIPLHPLSSPSMTVWGACTFGMATRAIYVPSTSRRTAILTAVAGIPVVVASFVQVAEIDPQVWAPIWPELAQEAAFDLAAVNAIFMMVWWLLTVGLCAGASNTIYGLRVEASEARKLGQYTLERKLGQGGMGEVYTASHALLRRPTAIKLLHPEKTGEESLARFEREVQLTAQLTHPNTVTIYDYGRTPAGVFYYAMELLEGATLEDIVEASGAQEPARVVHILSQVADALVEAHEIGLIHRDIKPANIMLCRRGGRSDVAKVLDFGLVKDLTTDEDASLTRPEVVTGTPLYMSPEAISNPKGIDARSDIYALGAVGYYLLTGTHVFRGNTLVELCAHHLNSPVEPPEKRLGTELPEPLTTLILRCLEKAPEDRPQSAALLRDSLSANELAGAWGDNEAETWWRERWSPPGPSGVDIDTDELGETMLAVDMTARAE